jgi:hypothetical protein
VCYNSESSTTIDRLIRPALRSSESECATRYRTRHCDSLPASVTAHQNDDTSWPTACLLPFGMPFLNRLSAPLTRPRGLLASVENFKDDCVLQIQSQQMACLATHVGRRNGLVVDKQS